MQKITAIAVLLILFAFVSQAQGVYSKQNLEQTSQENLNNYLLHAKTKQKTGAILSITGSALFLTGILIDSQSSHTNNIGLTGAIIGSIGFYTTLVGIPILIVGSSRVKKIKKIMTNAPDEVFIELAPCSFQNYMAKNNQTGVTLRIRF